MTRRLVLSYLGLAFLILAVLEVPLGALALHHERGVSAQAAEREAMGVAVFANEDIERHRSTDLTSLVDHYQVSTGGEIWVVDTSGRVIAMSDTDSDSDVSGDDARMVHTALDGRPVSTFGLDEGRPWAKAAVPITDVGEPAGAVLLAIPSTGTIDRVHDIWLALAAFGAGLLVLSGLLGVLLARSLTRPLRRLESTVTKFAAGDLAVRASPEGPAEMRELAGRFNHMASRLQNLLNAQSRFVADASHQLRSPLTALRLRLENLEAGGGPGAAAIAAAGQEVQRLSRIVDGLLTLGRTEGQAPELQSVDVARVVAERCEAWAALADERRIALSAGGLDRREPPAWLVPGDLDQMLDNLIANAIDALDPGGRIEVRVERLTGPRLEVHVIDDGPGMDEEDRTRAFDRFWQGPGSKGGHSGLGLAIVAQLAARNGAAVELRQALPSGLDATVEVRLAAGSAPSGQRNVKDRQKLPS